MRLLVGCIQSGLGSQTALFMRSELGGSGHLAPATTGAGRAKGIRWSELGGSDHLAPGTTERERWNRRTALAESANGGSGRTGNEKCRTKECAVEKKIEREIETERVAHTHTERETQGDRERRH
jgi:hypothetical protein